MSKTENLVRLAHLCQGGFGFVDLHPGIAQAIRLILLKYPPAKAKKKLSLRSLLSGLKKKGFTEDECAVIESYQQYFRPLAYPPLTVKNILVDKHKLYFHHLSRNDVSLTDSQAASIGQAGWATAFIFFQFFFHEKNENLKDPDFIWKVILDSHLEKDVTREELCLACYIQLVGIRHDISQKRDHYLKNVANRADLEPEHRQQRIELFSSAVELLIAYARHELIHA